MNIKIIEHKDIDKAWWDAEIMQCKNSLIYAKSWYLDAISPGWKAGIIGDNEAFIPITSSKRFGILPVWFQPLLAQQLGFFFKAGVTLNSEILARLKKPFFKTQIHLNAAYLEPSAEKRTNYILNLHKTYDELRRAYTKDARKNLKKPVDFEIKQPPFTADKFELLTSTYQNQYGKKEKLTPSKINIINRLLFAAKQNNALNYFEMTDSKGTLLLSAATLIDSKRIYYLFAAPTDLGRKQSITHFFINHLIESNSGKALTLDFEGSMIPSVARFYKKWGVQEEIYGVYK